MKKLIVWMLILCLSASLALAESSGSFTYGAAYDTAAEARRLALECLESCGFYQSDEDDYTKTVRRDALIRWTDCIYVQAKGSPTSEDLEELKRFLAELGLRVPEMPCIFLTDDDNEANLTIYYAPKQQLPDLMSGYPEHDLGWSHVWWKDEYPIYKGEVGIASDETDQNQRNYLMRRHLVGSLGLIGWQDLYDDSVLYDSWTWVQTLSEVDWMMLNMLYTPFVRHGMTYEQVREIIENRFF